MVDNNMQAAIEQVTTSSLAAMSRVTGYLETHLSQISGYVDPREATLGPDGEPWIPLGQDRRGGGMLFNETNLAEARNWGRYLAAENEFAISGHENRVSYIVGWGFTYTAQAKPEITLPEGLLPQVQGVIDEFIEANRWHHRQQEIVMRRDRDGECFLRFSQPDDGILRVRFVEPESVVPPAGAMPNQTFGVETDPEDIETVLRYWISNNGEPAIKVDASQIQHRKRNVDSSCKRGWPTFYPVRKNLLRAGKILRNMSTVAEIQSAIAMIRKHAGALRGTVQSMVATMATAQVSTGHGQTEPAKQYAPGTVLDTSQGTEYEFPSHGIDPSKYISALQAELRAVSARLNMPEFMLTSDASNANFASTMVAEGPAVKNFQRLQWDEIQHDQQLFSRVLKAAAAVEKLPKNVLDLVTINMEPPSVQVRDRLKDVQCAKGLKELGVASTQTLSTEFGYDYEQEQSLIEEHDERSGVLPMGERPSLDNLDPATDPAANPADDTDPADDEPDPLPGAKLPVVDNDLPAGAE